MMNQIFNAISAGYGSKQIIDYIMRQFPQHKDKIKNALAAGYTTERVLQFLTGGRQAITNNVPMKTEHERTIESERQKQSTERKATLGAGTAIAAPLFAPMAEAALSRAAPQILQKLQPSISGTITQNIPNAGHVQSQTPSPALSNISQNPPNVPINAGSMQQGANIPQAKTSITDIIGKFKGLPEQIDKLKASGNGPEEISAYLKKFQPKYVENLEKESGHPIEEVIGEYLASKPESQNQLKPTELVGKSQEGNNAPDLQVSGKTSPEILPEVSKPLEKEKPAEAKSQKELKHNYLFKLGELPALKFDKGKLIDLNEKTHKAAFGKEERPIEGAQKALKDLTYEEVYKDASPEDKRSFKVIDNALHKLSQDVVSGKTFAQMHRERLPEINEGLQLSTARDVLDFMAGLPSKYQLLSSEEQEDAFSTFQGLTPNVIWNMLSLTDPRIQKIKPISPKGMKEGKKEYTPNDFRRMLAHGVHDFLSKHEKFGEKARFIVPVVNMMEIFKERKNNMQQLIKAEVESMTDEDLNELLASVDESLIKKIR